MIAVLSANQIREADQFTILHEPISSLELMERAASHCAEVIIQSYGNETNHFTVFCGSGNNGGDGLVIARILHQAGFVVKVYLVRFTAALSADCETNLNKLKGLLDVEVVQQISDIEKVDADSLIIDALLGTGTTRRPDGLLAEVIEAINRFSCRVISIDLPSGLMADQSSVKHEKNIIKASKTLTLGAPKMALLMPENEVFVGTWEWIDIGLHAEYFRKTNPAGLFITEDDIKSMIPHRPLFGHKGHFGHLLLVAGSRGMAGAAVLASMAATRSGCGLVSVYTPGACMQALQCQVPEAICIPDSNDECISSGVDVSRFTAIGFGPGVGTSVQSASVLKQMIQNSKVPMVIDADGLNILSQNKTWLSFLPKGSIITPHPGEFERLSGKHKNHFERMEAARAFAMRHGLVVVLKGAYTLIATPDGTLLFNSTGNPGMAKGGSGDVLTGCMSGLLARGFTPEKAAILGVFLHGLAGDEAAMLKSMEAMNAGDIANCLSNAWLRLM